MNVVFTTSGSRLQDRLATTVYESRPADIDSELYRLSANALGSDELAKFTVSEILPLAADKDAKSVLEILWQAYKSNKFGGPAVPDDKRNPD